jgi:Uma2 family endonuclease
MTHAVRHRPVPAAEYLEAELSAPTKSEYVAGRVHAMVGATRAHNRVTLALWSAVAARLRPPCEAFASDVKVRVEAADAYYYPDVVVACDPADRDPSVVLRPSLVVEVLSPSTENTDRREKLPNYLTIPGLQAVVLVDQDRPRAEVHRRDGEGWLVATVAAEGSIEVPALGLSIPLAEIHGVHGA